MKLQNLVLSCIVGLSLVNSAQAMKSCPFPIGLQASIGVAKEVLSAKAQGRKKEALLARMPPEKPTNAWLISLMREITDEVYDFPVLPSAIYTTYRGELCFQIIKKPDIELPIVYSRVLPLLQPCVAEASESDQRKCTIRVVDKLIGVTQ